MLLIKPKCIFLFGLGKYKRPKNGVLQPVKCHKTQSSFAFLAENRQVTHAPTDTCRGGFSGVTTLRLCSCSDTSDTYHRDATQHTHTHTHTHSATERAERGARRCTGGSPRTQTQEVLVSSRHVFTHTPSSDCTDITNAYACICLYQQVLRPVPVARRPPLHPPVPRHHRSCKKHGFT